MNPESNSKDIEKEETILSSSFHSAKMHTDDPLSEYTDFRDKISADQTINSTMIEDFSNNVEIAGPSRHESSFLQNYGRNMLAIGPRRSWQHITNTSIRPEKSFWITSRALNPSKLPTIPEVGFHKKDDIFGELSCNSCSYTTFEKGHMMKHINKWHRLGNTHVLNTGNVPISPIKLNNINSARKESEFTLSPHVISLTKLATGKYLKKKKDVAESSMKKDNGGEKMDIDPVPNENQPSKVSLTSKTTINDNRGACSTSEQGKNHENLFHMKDPVSKELICDVCQYEAFGKKKMIAHVAKIHAMYNNLPPLDNPEPLVFKKEEPAQKLLKDSEEKIEMKGKNYENLFHMKDPVSKELKCDVCLYEAFGKKKMIAHVTKLHAMYNNLPPLENPEPLVFTKEEPAQKISKYSEKKLEMNIVDHDTSENIDEHSVKESSHIKLDENKNITIENDKSMERRSKTNEKGDDQEASEDVDAEGLKEFEEIVVSSSFDEGADVSSSSNNRKRVRFEKDAATPAPKRKMVSPARSTMDDSF